MLSYRSLLLIGRCCFIYYISHFFFFFKQKTAYEMRISDWSSDVCSSDLKGAMHCGLRCGWSNQMCSWLLSWERLQPRALAPSPAKAGEGWGGVSLRSADRKSVV